MRIPLSVNVSEIFGNNCIQLSLGSINIGATWRTFHPLLTHSNRIFGTKADMTPNFQIEECDWVLFEKSLRDLSSFGFEIQPYSSLRWRYSFLVDPMVLGDN